jgi:uncharacterized protein
MDQNLNEQKIISIIKEELPLCQAIYIFGSFADSTINQDSDVDIAVLLPHENAKKVGSLTLSDLHHKLSDEIGRDVDLINLRLTTTVLQKEIIFNGRCIFCTDNYAKEKFEMLTISFYQKLNEERKEILEEFYARNR